LVCQLIRYWLLRSGWALCQNKPKTYRRGSPTGTFL
jgi:hypothetical protein